MTKGAELERAPITERRTPATESKIGDSMSPQSRRSFLKTAVAGAAAVGWAGAARGKGAEEQIRVGLIGCGQRGRVFVERAQFLCDPDQDRLAAAANSGSIDSASAVTDLRRILDNRDVEAVIIATPDHWHAPAAILACEAGKHVYVEKPCSHNFHETQLLAAAARRNKVVFQHGTQQRSRAFTANAIQMLRDGLIGEVLVAKAWNIQRRKDIGRLQPSSPPPNVDYDLWVGPAEMLPFQANRFHGDWHWWHNFGTGDIGNDGAHELDYARWGLGVDTLPTKITAVGGKYFFADDQQYPDTATCVFEYPGGGQVGQQRQLIFEMRLWSKNYPLNCDAGVEFYGSKGKMFLSKRGKLVVTDDNNEIIHEEKAADRPGLEHFDNFIDAVRGGHRPNADIDEAYRSVALIHLANVALRVGRSLSFDPQSAQIVRDAEASALLTRTYRREGHWAIPKV
jgi:predicted dehydrogenase